MHITPPAALLWGVLLSAPFQVSAAPCPDGKCSPQSLSLRAANPVAPIFPHPEPVVPKPIPEPVVPKPVVPGSPDAPPAAPEPLRPGAPEAPAPKPPAGGDHVDGPVCRRFGSCFADPVAEKSRSDGAAKQKVLDDRIAANPLPEDHIAKGPLTDYYDGQNIKLEEYYWDTYQKFWENIPGGPKDFDDWHVSKIITKGDDPKKANSILEMYSKPGEGTMAIPWSFNRDNDPIKQLKWTEMVRDNWVAASKADGVDPKNLRFMAKDNIVKDERTPAGALNSQEAIDAAWEKVGKPETMMTFRRNAAEGSNELAAYELIANTPHGDRAIKFATDYQKEFELNVKAFHVFRPGTKDGPAPNSQPPSPESPGSNPPSPDPNAPPAPPHDPNAGTQYAIVIEFEPAVRPQS